MPTLAELIARQPEGRDPARARRRALRLLAKLDREAEQAEQDARNGIAPERVYGAE
jgi:hypothetical protein